MWQAKLKAFSLHFIATALVAALAALLVFKLWYPPPFAEMMGGMKLFVLVVACDLVLGPLVSLVIYNPKKKRKELLTDYAVVVVLQLAALAYGLHTVTQVRPAFLVFAVDRYTVVSAGELPDSERQKAVRPEWQKSSFLAGYQTVYALRPTDPDASFDLIMSALGGGRDVQHVVENYRQVAEHLPDVIQAAKPVAELRKRFAARVADIDAAVAQTGQAEQALMWLPVQAGVAFWTALIDARTGLPLAWLNLDPL